MDHDIGFAVLPALTTPTLFSMPGLAASAEVAAKPHATALATADFNKNSRLFMVVTVG
ncbi:MAG: hypothetical protein IV085_02690 [Thiobacillus sp.]|nr:hypothetical protein [Thiobacillus sp.]